MDIRIIPCRRPLSKSELLFCPKKPVHFALSSRSGLETGAGLCYTVVEASFA